MQKLGILGGGQLGRMLALEARRFGLWVATLDTDPDSPCGQVADSQTICAYDDLAAVLQFARECDILTFEFENIPQATIAALEAQGHRVAPSASVLAITQDRFFEKTFVRACGLQTAAFAPINDQADLAAAAATTGFPAILKTRRGGYDGKGQWRVADYQALHIAFAQAQDDGAGLLILEAFVPFSQEISLVAARGYQGEFVTFPVSENIHDKGILVQTIVPAAISISIEQAAVAVAEAIGQGLNYVGAFAVEMFVVGEMVVVNEIAPRVHNTGHHTLEATSISQFELHLRAILGWPLVTPRLLSPAVMMNLLGTDTGDRLLGLENLLALPETTLHLYGKQRASFRRKMGHVTVLGRTRNEALARAETVKQTLSWG